MDDFPNYRTSIGGLSDEQVHELRYRMERGIPANFAGMFDPDEVIFAIVLFADELTLIHAMSRRKMLELAQQLTDLATGRVTNRQ